MLSKSWDMFMAALGGERETVGDAIFGALSDRLICIKAAGIDTTWRGLGRAVPGFDVRRLGQKGDDPLEPSCAVPIRIWTQWERSATELFAGDRLLWVVCVWEGGRKGGRSNHPQISWCGKDYRGNT